MPFLVPFGLGLVAGGGGALLLSDDLKKAAKWAVVGGLVYLVAKDRGVF